METCRSRRAWSWIPKTLEACRFRRAICLRYAGCTRRRGRADAEFSLAAFAAVWGAFYEALSRWLTAFSGISSHFRPHRHLMTAHHYRAEMTVRFTIYQVTGAASRPTTA